MNDNADPRAGARSDWARNALGDANAELVRASVDAGFRSYWRTQSGNQSRIVMDSPPDREDVRPWLRMRALLEGGGVRVPRVLVEDVEAGFLLLEDLGAETYLHLIDAGNADALFDDAMGQLLRLQAIAPPADLPRYDAALLLREMRLFDEWFLGRHLGLSLAGDGMETLELAYQNLAKTALAQPQVLVHRDFMPRNLMPAADGPAVLDFQDAVRGPVAYDPLSLFKDAFLSWPPEWVQGWLRRYHERALAAGVPVPRDVDVFLRDADWIGVQRHLKVIGIFARLHHRDGKSKYLADVPRFFDYLDAVLPRHEPLAALHALIEAQVKPAMARLAGIVRE